MAQMLRAQSTFLDLLREVSRAVAATVDDPVTWIVQRVSESSIDYALLPVSISVTKPVPPGKLHEMTEAVPEGFATLGERAERPRYFTDRALELTHTLATVFPPDKAPSTRNGTAEAAITKQAGTHARHILDQPYISDMGTVEGKLEVLNLHGKRQFVIFDELTGQRIECHFGHRIALDQITAGAERRVAVTGEIRSRESGEILSVIATEIEVFPPDDELPNAADVLGILAR